MGEASRNPGRIQAPPAGAGPPVPASPATPAGWWALVPGLAQWNWGQRERGAVLAGSYLSAMLTAVFAWGTLPGLGMLGFALAAHLRSTADALRQPHFPALGERADPALVFWCLLGGIYAPVLGFAAVTAWPGAVLNLDSEGYLVNLWAFRASEPEVGAYVWFRPTRQSDPRLGRVVGRPGQHVDWADGWIRSEGVRVSQNFPGTSGATLRALSFRIPNGHLLVRPEPRRKEDDPGPLLVEQERVIGRAWAQSYPVRQRHLLH